MTRDTLIQGGVLVLPDDLLRADMLVRDGCIVQIGCNLDVPQGGQVVDATDCLVMPGVIDAHTHIALDTGIYQTADDWFIGTRAAACGGVTTVIDFATQFPGQTLRQAVMARLEEARPAVIDYALHVMVTQVPPGQEGSLADLVDLGTPSMKLYTTYRPNYYVDDAIILRLFKAAAALGIQPLVHCENDALVTQQTEALIEAGQTGWLYHAHARPALAEQEAVRRVILLAEAANCPLHVVHCSTARSVEYVLAAQRRGQVVTCETCPQYLLLDDAVYKGDEPWRFILQPPLRTAEEVEDLWCMLLAGAIDYVVTDHCDYTREQKLAQETFTDTPGGLPGLQTLLPLMFTYGVGEIGLDVPGIVNLLATNPARIWGLWPRKGVLRVGSDADVVIYDPHSQWTLTDGALLYQAGYTPYEGMAIQGRVKMTMSRGRVIYRDGAFVGERGAGAFLPRNAMMIAA